MSTLSGHRIGAYVGGLDEDPGRGAQVDGALV